MNTKIAIALITIITLSGCAVQTAETDSHEYVYLNGNYVSKKLVSQIDSRLLDQPLVCLAGKCMRQIEETEELEGGEPEPEETTPNTDPELEEPNNSEPETQNGPPTGTLEVTMSNVDGGFIVMNVMMQVVVDKDVIECPSDPTHPAYTCDVVLPVGTYVIEFDDVLDYETPSDISISLSEVGASVFVSYLVPSGPPTGTLKVNLSHIDGGFDIMDVNMQVIVDKDATGCPLQSGFYACEIELPTGTYVIDFDDVPGYATPSNAFVNLSEVGTMVWGSYL